jgi:hypothetical protein
MTIAFERPPHDRRQIPHLLNGPLRFMPSVTWRERHRVSLAGWNLGWPA